MSATTKPAANAAANESANAANAASVEQQAHANASEKVKIVVHRIRLYEEDGKSNIQLRFKTPIHGYKWENGVKVPCDVTMIYLRTFEALEQLRETNKLIRRFLNRHEDKITQAMLSDMLTDAKLTLLRTHHVAGEENLDSDVEGAVYEENGYFTEIVAAELDELGLDYIKNN